jgi:hypothetical protein
MTEGGRREGCLVQQSARQLACAVVFRVYTPGAACPVPTDTAAATASRAHKAVQARFRSRTPTRRRRLRLARVHEDAAQQEAPRLGDQHHQHLRGRFAGRAGELQP